MWAAAFALSLVSLLPAETGDAPLAVAALPLQAGEGVSRKSASGVDTLFRERLEASGFLKVLPRQKPDAREAFRCGVDPGCLSSVAYARGADLLAAGRVEESEEGYIVRVVVVEPKADRVLRDVSEPVMGTREDMAYWLDRLVRRAFRPEALAGGLLVVGSPAGARVFVDDAFAGTLPFDDVLEGVIEGEHRVSVEHPGYAPFTRRVDVRFREVTQVDVVLRALLPDAEAGAYGAVEAPPPTGVLGGPMIPLAVAGASLAALAGGALFGTLALLDQLEVERRAEMQLLLLPQHQDLLARGEAFALTANVLYGLAGVGLVSAGVLFVVDLVTQPAPEESPTFRGPADGAPARDEMRPRLHDG